MKRFLAVLAMVLVPSITYAAGTWSHEILRTKQYQWGWEVIVTFDRNQSNDLSTHIFTFKQYSQIASEGPARWAKKKQNLELSWSDLNRFDIGEDSKEILKALIIQVRNSPNATVQQAINWYDTNYPDALWKGSEFFKRARRFLKNQYDIEPTWDQFKTYVINNIFEGIDG